MRDVGAAVGREVQVIRCTTICNIWAFAGYAAAGCGVGRRAGSLETCGFKQTFWSLLGLWPKVTRARGRGISPIGGAEENRRAVEDAGPYGCVHRDAVKHRGAGGGRLLGQRPLMKWDER